MNSKRSARRSRQSQDFQENSNLGIESREVSKTPPKEMTEWYQRVEAELGNRGATKAFWGLDTNVDPVALAQVAAHFAPRMYSQEGYQKALVNAAQQLICNQQVIGSIPIAGSDANC
jgi:hypothetical protein